jgi:hypothetical protein
MKASARLRKAAASDEILVRQNYYFITMDNKYGREILLQEHPGATCVACAVGSMVACCEPVEIVDRVNRESNGFYETVETLAPELLTPAKGLECPFAHWTGEDGKPERGDYSYGGRLEISFGKYDLNIARFVEHLFEDHDITDLNEIADIIEPMGY